MAARRTGLPRSRGRSGRARSSDLARFLADLWALDVDAAPVPGEHHFHRGGDLAVYEAQTLGALDRLGHSTRADVAAVRAVWDRARSAGDAAPTVSVHGDVAPANMLVVDGRLAAVIDFGCCAVGDPAIHLVVAWTFFTGPARERFCASVDATGPIPPATWDCARGWALWKALISLGWPRPNGELSDELARTGVRHPRAIITDLVAEVGGLEPRPGPSPAGLGSA